MENITTDAQIPTNTINRLSKGLIVVVCCFSFFLAFAQSPNGRAVKLTQKAEEEASYRNFEEAKKLLKKAIAVDPSYPKPYLRLATIYNLYQELDSACTYYNRLVEKVSPSSIDRNLWSRIAGINYQLGYYSDAKYALNHLEKPDSLLLASVDFSLKSVAECETIDIQELSSNINSYGLQYFPTLTVDEKTIIYTKRNDHVSDEDMVISQKINGHWIPAQSISLNINTRFNEGASTISADGSILIFTACEGRERQGGCDLFLTRKVGMNWSEPQNMGTEINSAYWDSQPSLSADGRTLYFSSNRPGGFGKRDLWVSSFSNGQWESPKNLGTRINTPHDETTPFIHVNNNTLFFASQGHPGLGGLDLFSTQLLDGVWTAPINLGCPINSEKDEISLFINAAGTTGYFAKEISGKESQGKSVLVTFPIANDSLLSAKSSYVVGVVRDRDTNQPLGTSLRMHNLTQGDETYHVTSDSITGKFYLVLNQNNEYGVFIQKSGYLFENLTFKSDESNISEPDTLDIYLKKIKSGESVILDNIYFDSNSARLNTKSRGELQELADYLLKNPDLVFTIEGHTDNTGTEVHNKTLSIQRAGAVRTFLIEESIESKRITIIGYGSTKSLYSNETEEGRSKNRRITFRLK